eukprot:scaffold32675_cov61-Phaeocystis_antarctica.AAC.2
MPRLKNPLPRGTDKRERLAGPCALGTGRGCPLTSADVTRSAAATFSSNDAQAGSVISNEVLTTSTSAWSPIQ